MFERSKKIAKRGGILFHEGGEIEGFWLSVEVKRPATLLECEVANRTLCEGYTTCTAHTFKNFLRIIQTNQT
jgi:hypothetical protein